MRKIEELEQLTQADFVRVRVVSVMAGEKIFRLIPEATLSSQASFFLRVRDEQISSRKNTAPLPAKKDKVQKK